jgi:hypothetical protein
MKKKNIIVVAHPDDEVLFFSSKIKSASKIIICFSTSDDKVVSLGRKRIQNKFPLKNIVYLNFDEANVFNSANWINPKICTQGVFVGKNKKKYIDNYYKIKSKLSQILSVDDIIYTHNPWGEYGHEEHIQVFNCIRYFQKKLNLKIFVSGYVSNKSYNLMKKFENTLTNPVLDENQNIKFANKLKKIYITNYCWTFDDNYIWPKTELFFEFKKNYVMDNRKKNYSSTTLLNYLHGEYKINFIKKFIHFFLSYRIKKLFKKILINFYTK